MSTTTIRLPLHLKERVTRAAARAGTTAHGFILSAIAEKAEQEELREAFHGLAEERLAGIATTGKTIAWKDMRGYLEARAAGTRAVRPKVRKSSR